MRLNLRRGAAIGFAAALATLPFGVVTAGVVLVPLAAADAYAATEDVPLVVAQIDGVLANDNPDVDTCVLSTVDTTNLTGDVTMNPDGSFTYQPPLNFNGQTSFVYGIVDVGPCAQQDPSSQATVTINVAPVNDKPTAKADSFIVLKDRTLNVGVPGVLINDSDVDGDTLTAKLESDVSHGTLLLAPSGAFAYTPASGYTGPDAFSYRASDGLLNSAARVVSLTVTAIPPVPTPTPVPTATPAPTDTPEPTLPEPSPSATPEASPSIGPSPSPADSTAPSAAPSASPGSSAAPVPVGDSGGVSLPVLLVIVLFVLLVGFGAALYLPKWLAAQRGEMPDDGYGP